MTLRAVTRTSSGRQFWKDSVLVDVTVIFSLLTEFSFISQSEAGLSFSMERERPSSFARSTLHNPGRNSNSKRQT